MQGDVKDLWWEGDDLFIEMTDGRVYKFEGAYAVNHSIGTAEEIQEAKVQFTELRLMKEP